MKTTLRWIAYLLIGLIGLIVGLYLFGVIYFDGPFGGPGSTGNIALGAIWVGLVIFALVKFKGPVKRLSVAIIAAAVVLLPWSLIRPSNDRDWKPEFGETGWVDIKGDELTFHQVRNFDYAPDGTPTEQWETRTHHLSALRGIDYFHDAWGGTKLAHPIMSFDFGEEGHLALSIETRREKDESFSTVGGLYKMFELQYLFGTEEDLIRLRTNIRKEPVYLYRLAGDAAKAQEVLMESITVQNEMKAQARFYNVLTHNCTTSIRAQTPTEDRGRFDWRMIINGHLDELVYQRGGMVTEDLPFDELRAKAFINPAAEADHRAAGYSERIRRDRPGFR